MITIARPKSLTPVGIILYHGPSVLNRNDEIVVIATGFKRKSKNKKTGNTIQTWILNAKMNPLTAYCEGKDSATCGNCKHRSPHSGGWGTCYVKIHQAPLGVWKAWKRGVYENPTSYNLSLFNDKVIRIGSFGDPAMTPLNVWKTITKKAKSWVGYTHQAFNPKTDKGLKRFCMASCDTIQETRKAKRIAWRTFRIRTQNEPLLNKEFICPASNENGNKISCEKCLSCHGLNQGQNARKIANPVIQCHGRGYLIKRFTEYVQLGIKR